MKIQLDITFPISGAMERYYIERVFPKPLEPHRWLPRCFTQDSSQAMELDKAQADCVLYFYRDWGHVQVRVAEEAHEN